MQHIRYGRDGGRISRRDAHDNASNGADGASNAFAAAKDSKAERMAVKAARVAQERAEAAEDYAKGLQEKLNQAEHSVRMLRQQLYERTHGNPIHNLSAVPNPPEAELSAPGRRYVPQGKLPKIAAAELVEINDENGGGGQLQPRCAPGQEAQADVGPHARRRLVRLLRGGGCASVAQRAEGVKPVGSLSTTSSRKNDAILMTDIELARHSVTLLTGLGTCVRVFVRCVSTAFEIL